MFRLSPQESILIYIIDDDVQMAEMLSTAIESIDLACKYFTSAKNFFENDINSSDVILLDLNMPDVDGMTLVRFYRANHATKDIPVIVLSSKEDPKLGTPFKFIKVAITNAIV